MRSKMKIVVLLLFIHLNGIAQNDRKEGLEAFENNDYLNAIKYLKSYADKNDCFAQYAVGHSYSLLKEDSLAEKYLFSAANNKSTRAMGILATLLFSKNDLVNAYVWAELGATYDFIQKSLTTRYVIKKYLSPKEVKQATESIKAMRKKLDKKDLCPFNSKMQ